MLDSGQSREGFAIRSINYLLLFIVIVVIYMDETDAQDYFTHSRCISVSQTDDSTFLFARIPIVQRLAVYGVVKNLLHDTLSLLNG
jgi:hypothetical protein